VKIRTQRRPLPLFSNHSVLSAAFRRKSYLKSFFKITKRNRPLLKWKYQQPFPKERFLCTYIPEHHLVRVVNTAVNRLDDAIFAAAYPDGGRLSTEI